MDKVKVKFLEDHNANGQNFKQGQEASLDKELAKKLQQDGIVEVSPEEAKKLENGEHSA